MVLVAVVVVGIMASVVTTLSSYEVRAEREAELIFRGLAYRRAIRSYYEAGGAVKTFPRSLEDLLKDPRFPRKHHIRKLYRDPIVPGKEDEPLTWQLIPARDGGIGGVASSSTTEPLKQDNFPKELERFTGAKSYSEWRFVFEPAPVPPPSAPAQRRKGT